MPACIAVLSADLRQRTSVSTITDVQQVIRRAEFKSIHQSRAINANIHGSHVLSHVVDVDHVVLNREFDLIGE